MSILTLLAILYSDLEGVYIAGHHIDRSTTDGHINFKQSLLSDHDLEKLQKCDLYIHNTAVQLIATGVYISLKVNLTSFFSGHELKQPSGF